MAKSGVKKKVIETATKVVVNTEYDGSIIPSKFIEFDRDIFLKAGSKINGSVFGANVKITAPANVKGPIYASKSIDIKADGEKIILNSCIGCGKGSINIQATSKKSSKVYIFGDIYGGVVNISNAIILGNIYGSNAYIENSKILGFINVEETAVLNSTLAIGLTATNIRLEKENSLVLPFASAKKDIEMEAPVTLFPLSGNKVPDEHQAILSVKDLIKVGNKVHLNFAQRVQDLTLGLDYFKNLQNYIVKILLSDVLGNEDNGDLIVSEEYIDTSLNEILTALDNK